MKTNPLLAAVLIFYWVTGCAAADKSVLEIAPTLAELGNGWTTMETNHLIDPLCQPSELVKEGHPSPEKLLKSLRDMMKSTGRTGYLAMHYGYGDMVINRGGYRVSIQRWPSAEDVDKDPVQQAERVKRSPPNIGQEAYWTEGAMLHGLVFRRGQYRVVTECGPKSDHDNLVRLAEVIDAKISGKPIPQRPGPTPSQK
jgi:hypothetical protein